MVPESTGPFLNKLCKGAHNENNLRVPMDGIASLEEVCVGLLSRLGVASLSPTSLGAAAGILPGKV